MFVCVISLEEEIFAEKVFLLNSLAGIFFADRGNKKKQIAKKSGPAKI